MAVGFAKDGAEQEEIQAVIQAAVSHARKQLPDSTTISLKHCIECSRAIPVGRRVAVPGCRYCVECQADHDSIFKRDPRNCWHRSMK